MAKTYRHSRHAHRNGMRSMDDAFADSTNQFRYMFGGLDIFGVKPFEIYDSVNYMNDYMKNRNLSWSDMKYPTLAKYSGYGSSALNADMDAISSLYDDDKNAREYDRALRREHYKTAIKANNMRRAWYYSRM